jgi:hypothetical protein
MTVSPCFRKAPLPRHVPGQTAIITWFRHIDNNAPVAALPRFGPAGGVVRAGILILVPLLIQHLAHALPEVIAQGRMTRLARITRQRAHVIFENARLGRWV